MPDRVLVLHESATDTDYVSDELLARGLEVTKVNRIEDAIKKLKSTRRVYSLIAAPVHLVTGDVYDLLRWVRGDNEHKHDPFVFLCIGPTDFTKAAAGGIEAAARILGADEVIFADRFDGEYFWSLVEPLLSRKRDELEQREDALESREKFMHRREHRDDSESSDQG